jgi:hypothetical protein
MKEVLVRVGGIHNASATSPCVSFSLAGLKDGFGAESGKLLWDCLVAIGHIANASEMPIFFVENVPSTHDSNEQFDNYLPKVRFFFADASICSPSLRRRKFATNMPPVVCSSNEPNTPGNPPSLDGDHASLCASSIVRAPNRMVHPNMKKLPTFLHTRTEKCIWEQTDEYHEPKLTSSWT